MTTNSPKPGEGQSRSARRRRNRKGGAVQQYKPVQITTSAPTANDLFLRPSRKTIGKKVPMMGMSEAGNRFLKSVFAAPDFAGQGDFLGIPDEVTSIVCPYRHILTGDFWELLALHGNPDELKASSRVVIIQPPVPGVAFYFAPLKPNEQVLETTIFHPVAFDDFKSLFGSLIDETGSDLNRNVNQFRFAGNTIELICTSNAFSWKGSIRAFKLALKYIDTNAYQPDVGSSYNYTKAISGIEGVNATSAAAFITPANQGVYMTATNLETTFLTSSVPDLMFNVNGNNSTCFGILTGLFTGFGSLETNCIVLENVKKPDESPNSENCTLFQVRVWSMIEYLPHPQSVLYRTAHKSPECDPIALETYRAVVADLPVAVTYAENDTFWKRLCNVIGKIGGLVSNIPGPYGLIGGGIGTVASAIGGLLN